jgi:hypothetical protein
MLVVLLGLACAACTSGPSHSGSAQPRASSASPVAHPLLPKLHQQTRMRFAHLGTAVTVLASARSLQPGQQGAVLTVRKVGNLIGYCSPQHPAVTFRRTYRSWGPGPPTITEVRAPLAGPASLYLLGGAPAPSPVGGKQEFAFIQVVVGGESADFTLALWTTLTPVAGGCTFSVNGVLRVRCSVPSAAPICSYVFRRSAVP